MDVRSSRSYAHAVISIVLGAMVWPELTNHPVDSFPLSTYPMFAFRERRNVVLAQAVGERRNAERFVLPPSAFGTDEVLQAEAKLASAIRERGAAADALCADALDRELKAGHDIERVSFREISVDTIAYITHVDGAVEAGDDVITCSRRGYP